jgi:trans-aconitate methyltransferase
MGNKWQAIWENRKGGDILNLENLIALDGFDSGAGKIASSDWREYAQRIIKLLEIKDGNSIYEVGCGCGAFLYALNEHTKIKVGGNDYSRELIHTASRVFPESDFQCMEASNINSEIKYDFVISNSVFHYFNLNYARDVILKMLEKATQSICILEIPDLKTKNQAESLRRNFLSEAEYEKKYEGLHHTYYSREWFSSLAKELNVNCQIFNGCIPNYAQNEFRFGCILHK